MSKSRGHKRLLLLLGPPGVPSGIFHPKSFKFTRLETASEVPLAERQMAERSFSGQFGSKLPQKALKPPGTENV